jgi:hypothetical protein
MSPSIIAKYSWTMTDFTWSERFANSTAKETPAIALTGLASGLEQHAIVTAGFDG